MGRGGGWEEVEEFVWVGVGNDGGGVGGGEVVGELEKSGYGERIGGNLVLFDEINFSRPNRGDIPL